VDVIPTAVFFGAHRSALLEALIWLYFLDGPYTNAEAMNSCIRVRVARRLVLGSLCLGLHGCGPSLDAMSRTVLDTIQTNRQIENATLDPNIRYLRVTVDGRLAFIGLGSEDPHPQGLIEVWFSAQREVLRFQNGRVVGASGITTEWSSVSLPALPSWASLARSEAPLRWVRVRDVMPGYHFGVRDEILVQAIPAPTKTQLQNVDAQSLRWFEERQLNSGRSATANVIQFRRENALPPARYAVDLSQGEGVVIYGEQCLAANFCFTWQRWNPKKS
jgi:hypothetical protein